MPFLSPRIPAGHLLRHETKRAALWKFLILLGIVGAYTGFLAWQYGARDGGMLSVLSWSFFVLCTPVADAGFLLDFPVRLLFRVRMIFSEMLVWAIALSVNLATLALDPGIYERTFVTHLLKTVLETPLPYWGVVAISAAGTFLSVRIGDELLDLARHRDRDFHHRHGWKLELILTVFVFVFMLAVYGFLLKKLGLEIPAA